METLEEVLETEGTGTIVDSYPALNFYLALIKAPKQHARPKIKINKKAL
jgi:hypothetical protein